MDWTDKIPRELDDFQLIRLLGQGGMGVVYEARQLSLNRRVALKVLSCGLLTPKAVTRFRREAEAAGKLHHSHIVPIYSNGEVDGYYYYAMELIDGPSLDHVICHLQNKDAAETDQDSRTTVRENAESIDGTAAYAAYEGGDAAGKATPRHAAPSHLSDSGSGSKYYDNVASMIADVADALHHAHELGVIHRDVKPANLLLGPDGRLHINDFGLARVLDQPGMTVTGEFVGTPRYMSPEQISAGRAPLNHRTDIYSLGATLYELLTLEAPFGGTTREEVIGQILHKEPKPPRRLNRRVPVDLDTICSKSMEKDPDKRYQTAAELAHDLRRYVDRHTITARRIGPVGRAARWTKRHPTLAGAGCCVATLVAIIGLLLWKARADNILVGQRELAYAQQLAEQDQFAEALRHWGQAAKHLDDAELLGGEERLFAALVRHAMQLEDNAIVALVKSLDYPNIPGIPFTARLASQLQSQGRDLAALLVVKHLGGDRATDLGRKLSLETLGKIEQLADAGDFAGATPLIEETMLYLPEDDRLAELRLRVVEEFNVVTEPAGAQVFYRPYASAVGWKSMGVTPVEGKALPRRASFQLRIEKEGYVTRETWNVGRPVERKRFADQDYIVISLDEPSDVPEGMVKVLGHAEVELALGGLRYLKPVPIETYFMDKYEVTNEEYLKFVEDGGYQKRQYWQQPIWENGEELPWDAAMARFVDATGKPGPKGWSNSYYPSGQRRMPVGGISWYEAAAYARYVNKSLPTVYHWVHAINMYGAPAIVPQSNFNSSGPRAVDESLSMCWPGTYDMAGNVKEWCLNSTAADGRRFILGGGWSDPSHMMYEPESQDPFARDLSFGLRCVSYTSGDATELAAADIREPTRDYTVEVPAGDEEFQQYLPRYAYDQSKPLHPEDLSGELNDKFAQPFWQRQKVSFSAAYADERVIAYLFIPQRRSIQPPYQTVILYPGSYALRTRANGENVDSWSVEFLCKSGRAVIVPIYKATFERRTAEDTVLDRPQETVEYADHVVYWVQDVRRAVDYIEQRAALLDATRIGFFGYSWGATMGPIVLAVEERVDCGILLCGGLWQERTWPYADMFHFAARVRQPVLMLNGDFDNIFPLESSQLSLFRLLGRNSKEPIHDRSAAEGHSLSQTYVAQKSREFLDAHLGRPDVTSPR